ncbi:unnamed protein product [Adineta ricciae]|uniref:Peptidase M28 domain-containing protein n=1 Tax=Adineta ricciae TaxID=249248 RepID=A0A813N5B8_ADIRI|nr:unnamed protein product [Adineta ricciae]
MKYNSPNRNLYNRTPMTTKVENILLLSTIERKQQPQDEHEIFFDLKNNSLDYTTRQRYPYILKSIHQRFIKPINQRCLYKHLLLWVILFGCLFILAAPLALHFSYALPTVKSRTIPLNEFSEERARDFYPNLTQYGPRVSNTRADYLTRAFLISEIDRVRAMAQPNIRFELSLQNFSVAKTKDLQNIAVRVSNSNSSPNAPCLMLAVHYDSVEFSPGGSDDGSGVTILLEVLSNLVSDPTITFSQVNLIVLLTAAEEMGMEGAEVFVSNHKWKNDIRRFMNIDSAGGHEKAILYRVKPSQLIKDYAHVPRPHANVIGDDILGATGSDTDYSVFTTHGSLSGYDFAYYLDGYNYHTLIDRPSIVEIGALQHLGENILALSRSILLGKIDLELPASIFDDEDMIYFDILGQHLITYTKTTSVIVQSILIGLTVLIGIVVIVIDHFWYRRYSSSDNSSFSIYFYFNYPLILRVIFIFLFLFCYLLSIIFGILVALLIALITSKLRPLSWYGNATLPVFLYGLPCLIGIILVEALWSCLRRSILSKYPKKNPMELNTIDYIDRHCFNFERHLALLLFFAFLMSISIYLGFRSLYVFLLWSIFLCPIYLIIIVIEFNFRWMKKHVVILFNEQGWYWLFVPYIVTLIPLIHTLEMTSRLVRLAIPMMGRPSMSSIRFPQDLLICALVVIPAAIFFVIFIPNIQRTLNYSRTLILLAISCLIVFIVACTRQPFNSTHPKIIDVAHSSRVVYKLLNTNHFPTEIPVYSSHASIQLKSMSLLNLSPTLDEISRRTGLTLQNRECSSSTSCSFDDKFNRTMPFKQVELTSINRSKNYRFTFRHASSYQIDVTSSYAVNFNVHNSFIKPRTETIVDVQTSNPSYAFDIQITLYRCDLQDSPFLQSLTKHLPHIVMWGHGSCRSLKDELSLTVNF